LAGKPKGVAQAGYMLLWILPRPLSGRGTGFRNEL